MFDPLNRVDWDLLHRQKLALLEWLSSDRHPEASLVEALWGIIHLLDALQDDAIAEGRWASPDDHIQEGGV